MIESVSACGCWCTVVSTATRGRVTRSCAVRSMRSRSAVEGTAGVLSIFWNQSSPRDRAVGTSAAGRHAVVPVVTERDHRHRDRGQVLQGELADPGRPVAQRGPGTRTVGGSGAGTEQVVPAAAGEE